MGDALRFGPYSPVEVDRLVPRLTARGVAFDLTFDDKSSKDDLSFTPANSLALAEFRTRNYTAQYYYFDIDENVCRRDTELVRMMEEHLHQQHGDLSVDSKDYGRELDDVDDDDGNIIDMSGTDSHAFRGDVQRVRRTRAWLAGLALLTILLYWVSTFWRSIVDAF